MIRRIAPADSESYVAVIVDSGLFSAEEAKLVDGMLVDYFARNHERGHLCLVDDVDGELVAVAYCSPSPATDRTWCLNLLAVRMSAQRQGRGAALITAIEESLRSDGQRLLLIETSTGSEYAGARGLYEKSGFMREASVRDYWADGYDLILYRKPLSRESA